MTAAIVLVLGLLRPAHPMHTSAAEIDVGRDGVTVTLRVFRDDLAAEVGHTFTRSRVAAWAARAVMLHSGSAQIPLEYVGQRPAGDLQEIVLRSAMRRVRPTHARFPAFFDRFPDQVNVLRIRDGRRARTVIFARGEGVKPVT